MSSLLALQILGALRDSHRFNVRYIDVYEQIGSTQDFMMNQATLNPREWSACVAMSQHSGYGRQARAWHSSKGQVSFSWRGWVPVKAEFIQLISFNAALAVQSALIALGVKDVQLKWPNDIYLNNQKLAGILIAVCRQQKERVEIVLGIGLNRLTQQLPEGAIALDEVLNPNASVGDLIALILSHWLDKLSLLQSEQGRNDVRLNWFQSALWVGETVVVVVGENRVTGSLTGINHHGALRIATEFGEQIFMANEVQLRLSNRVKELHE